MILNKKKRGGGGEIKAKAIFFYNSVAKTRPDPYNNKVKRK